MLHLGDITKINGADVPPVNVVIGGSPCQDLSVAGKRAGLSGERSGLFIEQLRIIKEMRRKDIENGAVITRPRYMVWENVPGAFSSNKGEDFRIVLEETAKVVEPTATIPRPDKGKWTNAGAVMGDGWSIAWRVFDAQFWGVPQRRRRIALIADFGGTTAPEILFERESVSGNITPGGTSWKEFAAALAERFGTADKGRTNTIDAVVFNGENITSKENRSNPKIGDPCHTLNATGSNRCYCIQGNAIDRADTAGCNGRGWTEGVSYTLNTVDRPAVYDYDRRHDKCQRVEVAPTVTAKYGTGGGNTPLVYDARGNGDGDISPTLTDDHENRVSDYTALFIRERCGCEGGTLGTNSDQFVCAIDRAAFNQGINAQYAPEISENGINSTLTAKGASAVCSGATVRRLTPLECERLQGFPDGWTDIGDYIDTKGKKRKTSDTARYKALGNSIALPPWAWLLERLSRYSEGDYTMASLFDGIGGFPLIWETLNGEGTCLWASEIDEFPIAVTKRRFS